MLISTNKRHLNKNRKNFCFSLSLPNFDKGIMTQKESLKILCFCFFRNVPEFGYKLGKKYRRESYLNRFKGAYDT